MTNTILLVCNFLFLITNGVSAFMNYKVGNKKTALLSVVAGMVSGIMVVYLLN